MSHKIELPPDWTVMESYLVGYNFYYKGELVLQHPEDSDVIRRVIQSINARYTEESK